MRREHRGRAALERLELPQTVSVHDCRQLVLFEEPADQVFPLTAESGPDGSVSYTYDAAQREAAEASRDRYAERLGAAGYGEITTEIVDAPDFYYAEDYHQQYLAKNPGGYCGIGGTGVSCPVGVASA